MPKIDDHMITKHSLSMQMDVPYGPYYKCTPHHRLIFRIQIPDPRTLSSFTLCIQSNSHSSITLSLTVVDCCRLPCLVLYLLGDFYRSRVQTWWIRRIWEVPTAEKYRKLWSARKTALAGSLIVIATMWRVESEIRLLLLLQWSCLLSALLLPSVVHSSSEQAYVTELIASSTRMFIHSFVNRSYSFRLDSHLQRR